MSLPGSEILNIKNLSKVYSKNDAKALNDVSLTINSGEFVSVIGPSGAGKSTLLRCINRMVDATQGEVIFDGRTLPRSKARRCAGSGPVSA